MTARRMADPSAERWTLPTLFMLLLISQVHSSGVFELQLQSFRNDKGLNSDGNCCNGFRSDGDCSQSCKTFFRVCLSHFQAAISDKPVCTFGELTTPVVANNSVNFTARSDLPMDNPLKFRFDEIAWPGDFSLIVEAYHDSTLTGPSKGSPRELISRLAVQRSAQGGTDWYNSKFPYRSTELVYSYRFKCDAYYYGSTCEELCRPRDDQFGHYYCSNNGTKVCRDGWQGEYCDRAICLPGCHPDNGFCDLPNECRCRNGWEGKHCNECIPYPGCQHGYCNKPWTCECNEGWGGLFCNQDLNFCTHHAPCKNGGTCTNTGRGSYTCSCRPGFNGTNCESEIDHCASQPCQHGATCQSDPTGYTCSCPQGFFGAGCEQEANYCRPSTCFNGGTCVDHSGSYQCLCRQGYEGFHCERDTGGCKEDTCKNGGHCVNGQCICPTGIKGRTCEDDGRDPCVHKPCANGGTCQNLVNDFVCRCVAGYVGLVCETNVDDCEMGPCANGGSCVDLVNDFLCHCQHGWSAKDCSVNVNNCLSTTCQHGGTCVDLINDYECRCTAGFWGKDCQLYAGMTTPRLPAQPTSQPSAVSSRPPTVAPVPTTEDPLHQSGNVSGQSREEVSDLSSTQLLVVVCLGAGLPILLIIVVVVILLCRRRRLYHSRHNMDRETQQNYINNMNNRGNNAKSVEREAKTLEDDDGDCGGGGTGGGGGSGSCGGVVGGPSAVTYPAGTAEGKLDSQGGLIFTTTTTTSYPPPPLPHGLGKHGPVMKISNEEQQDINRLNSQAARDKAARKRFLRDTLGPHGELGSSPSFPSHAHRDSRVYDIDKPLPRRLEVDSLQDDTKVDIGAYQRHSGDLSVIVKPGSGSATERQDNLRGSVYLEPAIHRHSRYAEDYLATEV